MSRIAYPVRRDSDRSAAEVNAEVSAEADAKANAKADAEAATEILRMLTSSHLDLASQADLDDHDLLYAFGRL